MSFVVFFVKYWLNFSLFWEMVLWGCVGGVVCDVVDYWVCDDVCVGVWVMSGVYDEVDLEDMEWCDDFKVYMY